MCQIWLFLYEVEITENDKKHARKVTLICTANGSVQPKFPFMFIFILQCQANYFLFDNQSFKPLWDCFSLRKRRELEMTCASKSVVHKIVGRSVEGWDRQGHLVLYWRRVSSGARNLTEYVLVFCPHLQVKRPAGCMWIFTIVRSREKRLLLTLGGCSVGGCLSVFNSGLTA